MGSSGTPERQAQLSSAQAVDHKQQQLGLAAAVRVVNRQQDPTALRWREAYGKKKDSSSRGDVGAR